MEVPITDAMLKMQVCGNLLEEWQLYILSLKGQEEQYKS
jgi:hypothetical protein